MGVHHLSEAQLLALAKTASPVPLGATHVVLRKDGSKVEFGWEYKGDILDEPPAPDGEWNSGYKWAYWVAFPLAEVYPEGISVAPAVLEPPALEHLVDTLPWITPLSEVPADGWTEQSYYRVAVELFKGNVAHDAILFTGFLNDGLPRSYSCILCPTYDNGSANLLDYPDLRVKVLGRLFTDKGLQIPRPSKTAP